jgi:hypothetical protein
MSYEELHRINREVSAAEAASLRAEARQRVAGTGGEAGS